MKARTVVAGILASLLVLASASAGAAPKRRPKHRAPAAAESTATRPAVATSTDGADKHASASTDGADKRGVNKHAAAGTDGADKHAADGANRHAADGADKHAGARSGKGGAHRKKGAHGKKHAHAKKGGRGKKAPHPAKATAVTGSSRAAVAKAAASDSTPSEPTIAASYTEPVTGPATKAASLALPPSEPGAKGASLALPPSEPGAKGASLALPSSEPAAKGASRAQPLTESAGTDATPAPDTAVSLGAAAAAGKAGAPKPSRFLASGVPLAEVREGRFKGVGSGALPCGPRARWARVTSRWIALDAWGQATGTLSIGGSERYAGTGCHQVWFSEGTGQDGRGVLVAEGSGYSARPSAEWKADEASRKRFDRLYSKEEKAWTEGGGAGSATGRRTLFFALPAQASSVEGAPTQRRPVRWAVSGGRLLVVAYVGASGAWKVAHVLPPNGKANAYETLAVLDMNGDGLPEIVVHEEAGGVFTDRVLAFDPASMRWETAVESPGGASR